MWHFAANFGAQHQSAYDAWQRDGRDDAANVLGRTHAKLLSKDMMREYPGAPNGHIVCGPSVASSIAYLDTLRRRNRGYLAIDMESGGVMAAVDHLSDAPPVLVLRGISDYADERKASLERLTSGKVRVVAMRNVIRKLWNLLDAGII